jgi:tetratricopeptide (TPR) repeat protein
LTEPALRSNPYPGPRSFEVGETLYGRERETRQLLNLLIAERIVLLYSPSGAGKTSLIQAALIPNLVAEGFRVLPPLRVSLQAGEAVSSVRNRYIFSLLLSLEARLDQAEQTPVAQLAGMTLAEYLAQPHTQRIGFLPHEDDDWDGDVLIFDQFEEILTIDPSDRAGKQAFFAEVGAVLQARNRWALFAMREEFLAGLDPYRLPIPTRFATTFRLELLGPDAARQAMQRPARAQQVDFTDAAAQRLADDLRTVREMQPDGATVTKLGDAIEPVQLQVVCLRLWNNLAADDNVIDVDDLEGVGDVDSALATYYADSLTRIATETGVLPHAIRTWVHSLITESGFRTQLLQGPNQGLAEAAIWPLVDAHLIRAERRRGATWFELAHDRLVAPVQQDNTAWFAANLSTLQRQAALWAKENRPSGLLLREAELVEAEQWAAMHPDLADFEADFLNASRNERARSEREARQTQRIRWLAIGATVVGLLALVAAVWGWGERGRAETESMRANEKEQEAIQQANLAFTRQLLAQADQFYAADPLLGLRLALEADAHLLQDEPALRTQIVRQTRNYLAQGKIASLGANVAAFMDLLGTPWFIVKSNAENGKDQLRSDADGSLVAELPGAVSRINPVSDTFPVFVVDYKGDTPGELRSKADGSLVPGLAVSVTVVYPVEDAFPFFVVYYEGDTPGELHSKVDGSLVTGLPGVVNWVTPVNNTFPFFVVSYVDDTPAELRRKADGSLVPELAGAVSRVDLVSDVSPFFVMHYDDKTPAELRRKDDGSLLAGLTAPVARVDSVGPMSPFLVISYAGGAPAELRRKADGARITELPGSVDRVYTVSEESNFFVVAYKGRMPGELRRKTDGSRITELPGSVSGVYTLNEESTFFGVSYAGGAPGELRSKADGSLVTELAGWVNRIDSVTAAFPFFVVLYADDMLDELRRKADGSRVTALAGAVSWTNPVSDVFPFFVVDYEGDTPSELRRKADGSPVPGLAGAVSWFESVSDTFPFFVMHYEGAIPSELRRKNDGSPVPGLAGAVDWINPVSDVFPFFVVNYAGDMPGELRSKADGSLVPGLTGSVIGVDPVSDVFPFFVVDYADDTPSELRNKADGSLMPGLASAVGGVYSVSDAFPFFVVNYAGDTPDELRSKLDGSLVPGLAGAVSSVYPGSDAFPFFVVDYDGDTLSELRSKLDGSLMPGLAGAVNRVNPGSDVFPFFVVDYDGDTPAELRSKLDGSLVSGLAGSVSSVDPISEASPYFVVNYAGDTPGELRSKADGSLVTELPGPVRLSIAVSAASQFFVVYYKGDTPSELRRKLDGSLVTELPGSLVWGGPTNDASTFFVGQSASDAPGELRSETDGTLIMRSVRTLGYAPYRAQGYFFVERSDNHHTELWQIDPLRRLVDLGIGLPWADSKLPEDALVFKDEVQTLAIRYEDGRGYLLDLTWLEAMQERAFTDGISSAELVSVACLPFAIHPFDESLLHSMDYLVQDVEFLGERPTLACPQPLRLVEQGRQAARQLDLAAASELFRAAIAQDATLAIEPESAAARVAGESLARHARLLHLQGELDGAAMKFAEARSHAPSIEISPDLQRLVASQLSTGQAFLRSGEIVSATLRFDALVAMDETFGAGTLDQASRVAVAQAYATIGETLAQEGKVKAATSVFAKAIALDPALHIDPGAQATTLAAQTLLDRGRGLARNQHIEEAVEAFAAALALDPSIAIAAEEEARRLAAEALVAQGQTLAKWGNGQGALVKFAAAQALDPSLELDPVAEVTRLAPTPTATPNAQSPLATPTPICKSLLATPTMTPDSVPESESE